MSLEKPNQGRNALRAAIAAAQLMSLEMPPAQAANIESSATWEHGVSVLRESVMNDKAPSAVTYIVFKNGTGTWMPTPLLDKTPGADPIVDSNENAKRVLEKAKRLGLDRACQITTHPVNADPYKNILYNKGSAQAMSPPTYTETHGRAVIDSAMKGFPFSSPEAAKAQDSVDSKTFKAVFDSRGVWYHRQLSEKEFRQRYPNEKLPDLSSLAMKAAYDASMTFVRDSLKQGFDVNARSEQLAHAYAIGFQTELTFITYEDLSRHSPCSGPAAKPAL